MLPVVNLLCSIMQLFVESLISTRPVVASVVKLLICSRKVEDEPAINHLIGIMA